MMLQCARNLSSSSHRRPSLPLPAPSENIPKGKERGQLRRGSSKAAVRAGRGLLRAWILNSATLQPKPPPGPHKVTLSLGRPHAMPRRHLRLRGNRPRHRPHPPATTPPSITLTPPSCEKFDHTRSFVVKDSSEETESCSSDSSTSVFQDIRSFRASIPSEVCADPSIRESVCKKCKKNL